MRKLFAVTAFIILGLSFYARAEESICTPINTAYVRDAALDAYQNDVGELYTSAMIATNGDCAARKVLDDDLFMPMLTVMLYHEDIRSLMPKFREDVLRFRGKQVTGGDAKRLLELAWKIQHSR